MSLETPSRPDSAVSVLVVLHNVQEQAALCDVLSHSNWRIHAMERLEEAVAFLRRSMAGVVIAPYDAPGTLSWKDLIRETRRLNPPPRLVVTARQANASVWAEVLNLGAHDFLAQPFQPREVFHVVTCAWQSWKYALARAL